MVLKLFGIEIFQVKVLSAGRRTPDDFMQNDNLGPKHIKNIKKNCFSKTKFLSQKQTKIFFVTQKVCTNVLENILSINRSKSSIMMLYIETKHEVNQDKAVCLFYQIFDIHLWAVTRVINSG